MPASLRHTLLGRLQRRLEQRGYPRLQMALLVALTGGAGFLCSFTLLRSGIDAMWLRYLISVGAAYLAFLVLLWLWMRISAPSYVDLRDLTRLDSADPAWDDARREHDSRRGPSLWDMVDMELEFALPVMVLVFVGSMLVASCYIVYTAPVLFAELMLDGVLAVTLYHRLRALDVRHWLETAIRRTYPTFLLAGVILVVAGLGMSQYASQAKSMGEVLMQMTH
jgi:hypothetical protein